MKEWTNRPAGKSKRRRAILREKLGFSVSETGVEDGNDDQKKTKIIFCIEGEAEEFSFLCVNEEEEQNFACRKENVRKFSGGFHLQ